MPIYKIKYPYTWTVLTLLTIAITTLIINRDSICNIKYFSFIGFTLLLGLAQLHGLLNLSNSPGWYFPKGSAYLQDIGLKFKNLIAEDVLFIPTCASLFYAFMHIIRDVPDVMNTKPVIIIGLALIIIVEALIYQVGGKGCRILMVGYTLTPIMALLVIGFDFATINITHAFLSFLFVSAINCLWELFNAHKRHWIYNTDCELFSKTGWILNKKLHVSIFVQYAISGFIVSYFSWLFF
jgi:hypothetical protein